MNDVANPTLMSSDYANKFPTIRKHWAALILAIIVGILCVIPPLYFAHFEPNYAGIEMMGADAEDHYTARTNQALQGNYAISNTFQPDKSIPYILPGLGENITAIIAKVFVLSAAEATVLAKFLFPLIAILVIYYLGLIIFRSRKVGLISSAMVVLGDGLFTGASGWLALLHNVSINNSFLNYARPVNPQLSGILLFVGLIAIYLAFQANKKTKWYTGIICGLVTGLTVYLSPFVFSFLVTVQVLCFVWLLIKKEFRRSVGVIISGIVSGIIVIPFLINYLRLIHSPLYVETSMRLGISTSHAPIIGLWVPIILICAFFFVPKRFTASRHFFITSGLALLILLNQQIVTGHVLQPGHYHWYITTPLAGILVAMYIVAFTDRFMTRNVLKYFACSIVLLILIYNGIQTQRFSYQNTLAGTITIQKYAPIMTYLNEQPGKQFIWADKYISTFIPIYTTTNVANNRQAPNYLIAKSFFERTILLQYRLRNIAPKYILATLKSERAEVSSIIYALYWRNEKGSFEAIPDEILESLAKDYTDEYSQPLSMIFKNLGITMIIWDKDVEPEWKISSLPFVKKVYVAGNIEVYTIN